MLTFVTYCQEMQEYSESSSARVSSDIAGRALAFLFAAIKVVRRPRPIHPRGEIFEGHVNWLDRANVASGITWIDKLPGSGSQPVTARVSRSVGLAPPLPDVIGLAFRFQTNNGPADLALASSWLSVPGRFLLRPGRSISGTFSSLMPYRSETGPVVVGARTRRRGSGQWEIELLHATSTSTWRRFAVVSLETRALPDRADLRFDPIRNALPGADAYPWTRRLRQRSYRVTQRS